MKKLVFISLLFLIGCSTKPVNQVEKKDSNTEKKTENSQPLPKEGWIYNTPWGRTTLR